MARWSVVVAGSGGGDGSECQEEQEAGGEIPVLCRTTCLAICCRMMPRWRWRGCRPCVDRLKKRKAQASAVVLMLKAAAITRTVST